MLENEITSKIIGCAIKVHKTIGPGLLESAYEECLFYELKKEGLRVNRQVAIPLIYEDLKVDCAYRADLIVEDQIILELKSVESISEIHLAQTITYLKLTKCKVGLLINFNVTRLIDGLKRVVNDF